MSLKVFVAHYDLGTGFEAEFSDYHVRTQSYGAYDAYNEAAGGLGHLNNAASGSAESTDEELYPPRQGSNLTMIKQMVHKHQMTRSQQIDLDNLIELASAAEVFDGDERQTGDGQYLDGGGQGLALQGAPRQEMYIMESPSQSPQDEPEELELAEANSRKVTAEGDQVESPKFVISPMADAPSPRMEYGTSGMHQQVLSASDMADSDFSEADHDEEYLGNIVDEMMEQHPDLHKLQTVDSTNL